MRGELLSVERVSKAFTTGLFSRRSVWAVREVSFYVKAGEIFSLVGESGSGKSTIGKIILRLEKPSSGRVLFEGQDPFSMGKKYTRFVSVVFQDPRSSLNPRMKVRDIVEEPLLVHGERDRKERVLEALRMAGLEEGFMNRKPEELSGGQRQRVAIARAIVLKPRLIVADEPTSSLDMSYRAGILELFLRLREEGISTLLITHDIRAVEAVSDRVGVLYKGKLMEVGPSREVLKAPLHPYTQYLISTMPVRHPSERREKTEDLSSDDFEALCPFFPQCRHRLKECEDGVKEVSLNGRIVSCNLY
ncbi:MAG: ATP-binding cassette domain-containing protein [Aquificaceae bacterium]|jgi:peptide/nickel transport system ATP-binding protein|uniref:ATP-binding cassette domain-containing protein n=1 Tax=Hydrogenobacter sp. Uz 6-8 TaxID=3384828 RepID=UPI00309F29AE